MTLSAAQDGPVPGPPRIRRIEVLPFPSSRRAVTAAVRAGHRIVPMHGLLGVDATEARRLLADHEPPLSMTPFVVAAVARAVAVHPEGHAHRHWRRRRGPPPHPPRQISGAGPAD